MEKFGDLRDLKTDIHEWHYEFSKFKSRENNIWHSSDNTYRNIFKISDCENRIRFFVKVGTDLTQQFNFVWLSRRLQLLCCDI